MDVSEIITDALMYPFNNIKALVLYVVLGIISGIAFGGTALGILTGAAANNSWLAGGVGIIGFIISFIILLLISGYELDIVKYGIKRDSGAPGIDITRQVINAIKLIIVYIVYYIIPAIIIAILGLFLKDWILYAIAFILAIIFALAQFMAKCRLADTEELGHALAIGEAIGDISKVGIGKLLAVIIISFIIIAIVLTILVFVAQWNGIIGGILLGIFGTYLVFFTNRATGLLYSNV